MGLLYYITYKAFGYSYENKFGAFIFCLFQTSLIVQLPLTILYFINTNLYHEALDILFVLGISFPLIFNFSYYFRESVTKRIVVKYSYEYSFIDNNPTISFWLFILLPMVLLNILFFTVTK